LWRTIIDSCRQFQIVICRVFHRDIPTFTGHLRDTLCTSTCFHRRSKKKPTARRQSNGNLPAIYGNLTAICRILPYSAKSTKFCQVLPGPLLKSYSAPCIYQLSNQTNNIYPFFLFPYLLSLYNVLTLSHSLYT